MATTIELLEPISFEFIPFIDKSAFLKIEVVHANTLVDNEPNREMIWHRYSYADSVSGDYDIMFNVPFGLQGVSGDPL